MTGAAQKPYWHETIKSEADYAALADAGATWADVREKYAPPEWCSEHLALDAMGCWSLIGLMVTGRDYCRLCESSHDYAGEDA